uniref:PiggyBac transposable element-derived protein domain-containing protein n=1 Tax=Glossina austeni TaxID=7395 RepID=A0A1A9VAJ7_GLOAU
MIANLNIAFMMIMAVVLVVAVMIAIVDESMMLHRGKLSFRQFIKSKKNKYGIKFYELCAHDGYALNLDIHKGKVTHEVSSLSVVDSVVMRLTEPYLLKGHSLFMDNYYNSVGLSNRLLSFKTYTTGTLRTNRKMNPKVVTQKQWKKAEHIWRRQGNVYINKWKDKRDVICITTENHPKLIDVHKKYDISKKKPIEIVFLFDDNDDDEDDDDGDHDHDDDDDDDDDDDGDDDDDDDI